MYKSFREHKTSLKITRCALCSGYLSAVSLHIRIIREAKESHWVRKFWKRKKTEELNWPFSFSKFYERKLKQSGNTSKLTLIGAKVFLFHRTVSANLSKTFCLLVSQYLKISKAVLLVLLEVCTVSGSFQRFSFVRFEKLGEPLKRDSQKVVENFLSPSKVSWVGFLVFLTVYIIEKLCKTMVSRFFVGNF